MAVSAQALLDEAARLKERYPDADHMAMAEAVLAERENRIRERIKTDRLWIAGIILADRYTDDQGIDAEMAAYNAGLEAAAKIVRGGHQ